MVTPFLGYMFALGSALCNGSFASLSKCSTEDLSPVYFNSCLSLGVTISSWIFAVAYYDEISDVVLFDPAAAAGGCLLVLANYFAFLAIPKAGLALSQGIWGGVALVVSFFWGVYGPKPIGKTPKSILGSYTGVFFILCGIIGIAQNKALTYWICKKLGNNNYDEDQKMASSLLASDSAAANNDRSNMLETGNGERQSSLQVAKSNKNDVRVGLLYAVCTGIFGGSMLVPLELSAVSGLDALPSFGHGVFLASLIITIIFAITDKSSSPFPKTIRNIVPGILSGCIFNIGNTMSILAIPQIGFAVAQPLMQCALFVSGLWGIFLFREIIDKTRILMFFVAGTILICGALMLALFGP